MTEEGTEEADRGVVATRTVSGGIAGLNSTLTVREDGTLRLLDRRFGSDDSRTVPRERVRPLRDSLSGQEWQSVAESYGTPVPDGIQTVIEGGGRHTSIEQGPGPVEPPKIVGEILGLMEGLWSSGGGGERPATPQPNFFDLKGDGVEVTYGTIRTRGEFLDYSDGGRTVSLSVRVGDIIESQVGRVGTVVTADLNREEVSLDDALITLTLMIPRFSLNGSSASFRTVAIRTTHLDTGFRPGPVEGAQLTYEALRLRGMAGHVD